ncbi:MAG: ABC transporter ATP-binding protein [Acidimicrobiia bacterium]
MTAVLRAGGEVSSSPAGPAERPYLSVDGVGVTFRSKGADVTALSGVSLGVRQGEFLAIVGRSGCGKSTLLRTLSGLLPATRGKVVLDGQVVSGPSAQVRFVFQDYSQSLFPWKTVAGNVAFGVKHAVERGADVGETVEWALSLVGLEGVGGRYPWQLSGGMQQRVAIARALAARPQVLLMDEAFSSVDALSRAKLQDMILEVWGELKLTAVFVTHDIDEAVYLADRVVVVDEKGKGVTAELPIDLPRPRHQVDTRETPTYLGHRRDLLGLVLG